MTATSEPTAPDPATAGGADKARAAVVDVLALLDAVPERTECAFPGVNGHEALFFAQLSAVRQMVEIYYARALKPYGVTYTEYRVLSVLRTREASFRATPLDLNKVVQLTSAGMTRTLDRLETAGHIVREPNPKDRRSVHIGLTAAGWGFAGEVALAIAEGYRSALSDLSAEGLEEEIAAVRSVVVRLAGLLAR